MKKNFPIHCIHLIRNSYPKFGLNPVSVLYLSPAKAAISDSDENKIPFSTQKAVAQDVLLDVYVLKNREGCFCLSRQRKGLSG
jgi:hypothetical protein